MCEAGRSWVRGMGLPRADFWHLLVLVVCFACLMPRYEAACDIVLWTEPSNSTFVFGGAVTSPISEALELDNPALTTGWQGSLVLSLPGACPATVQALRQGLTGATLSTNATTGPLAMYPSQLGVRVTALPAVSDGAQAWVGSDSRCGHKVAMWFAVRWLIGVLGCSGASGCKSCCRRVRTRRPSRRAPVMGADVALSNGRGRSES